MLTTEVYSRYSRHLLLDEFDEQAQEQLMQSKVTVFGVGGLGCQVASALVAAGLGEIVLIDDDDVALSNLPRQWLFSEKDLGQKKVHSARNRLNAMQSACLVRCVDNYQDHTRQHNHLSTSHLILDCTDNVPSRLSVSTQAKRYNLPLITAAASGYIATVFAVNNHSDSPCYGCLENNSNHSQTCIEQGIFSPVVALAGQLQALLSLSYLTGTRQVQWAKLHYFNGRDITLRDFTVTKNPQCPVCSAYGKEKA